MNLHSDKGEVYVPVDSWLIFDGCEVYTVDDLSLGSERVAPPALGTGYLGTSLGTALFRDSRFFFPRQVRTMHGYLQFMLSPLTIILCAFE